jgi:hypothetical protein
VFCFSAFNGHCFGAQKLGDFGSTGSEVESVAVRPFWLEGASGPAHVHIMELDNDAATEGSDDLYLHSYCVPDPERL